VLLLGPDGELRHANRRAEDISRRTHAYSAGASGRLQASAAALSTKLHGGPRGAGSLGTPLIGVVLIADPNNSGKLVNQVNDMLVHAQTGARVVGTLAEDPAGAEQLAGRKRGRLDKSMLIRSARKVTSDLYQQYGAAWSVPSQVQSQQSHVQGQGAHQPPMQGQSGHAGGHPGHAGAGR
jgi:hypothetical protein